MRVTTVDDRCRLFFFSIFFDEFDRFFGEKLIDLTNLEADQRGGRNARGLARLFEFEEFEQEFEEDFEIHPDTLRPFGWRRI